MKTWIVRFASLYVFNVVVLLVIGLLLPSVRVGWSALWASIILTALTIWVKPVITKVFAGAAAKSAAQRTKTGEKLVQYGIVFVVEFILWALVVLLSGVKVGGFFWGWVIPPIILFIAWIIYDRVDDSIQARASDLYDKAETAIGHRGAASAPAAPSAATQEGTAELKDGLSAEQRKLLDDLGNN